MYDDLKVLYLITNSLNSKERMKLESKKRMWAGWNSYAGCELE